MHVITMRQKGWQGTFRRSNSLRPGPVFLAFRAARARASALATSFAAAAEAVSTDCRILQTIAAWSWSSVTA